MSYVVDWINKTFVIPQADLLPLTANTFQLDMAEFHKEIRRLEWDLTEGFWSELIVDYTKSKQVSGVDLAPIILTINSFIPEFQEVGPPYAVYLNGANTNLADVAKVNNVSIRPQNSAGLINLDALLSAAYQSEVVVDVLNGISGTQTPIGMRSKPSDNFTDAMEIAGLKGVNRFRLVKNVVLVTEDFSAGYEFIGDNQPTVLCSIEAPANVSSCQFTNLSITGILDNGAVIRQCAVYDLDYVSGFMHECSIKDRVTLRPFSAAALLQCYSNNIDGLDTPSEIDMGGSGMLNMRGCSGNFLLSNYSIGGVISVEISGVLTIDSTVTDGTIVYMGDCVIVNNSTSPNVHLINFTPTLSGTEIQLISEAVVSSELAKKSDVYRVANSAKYVPSSMTVTSSGSVIGDVLYLLSRDYNVIEITENAVDGLRAEFSVTITETNGYEAGVITVFGSYNGTEEGHYIELHAFNILTDSWEVLSEHYIYNSSVTQEFSANYYEQHIERNSGVVKFALVHNSLPAYDYWHVLKLDYISMSVLTRPTLTDADKISIAETVLDQIA